MEVRRVRPSTGPHHPPWDPTLHGTPPSPHHPPAPPLPTQVCGQPADPRSHLQVAGGPPSPHAPPSPLWDPTSATPLRDPTSATPPWVPTLTSPPRWTPHQVCVHGLLDEGCSTSSGTDASVLSHFNGAFKVCAIPPQPALPGPSSSPLLSATSPPTPALPRPPPPFPPALLLLSSLQDLKKHKAYVWPKRSAFIIAHYAGEVTSRFT